MSTAIQLAAQRINTARAGLTGQTSLPSQEPGAPQSASPTEVAAHVLPTEFGELTHLFGGGSFAETPTAQAPVNVSRVIPAGSVKGVLGGLAPDVRNTTNNAVATARKTTEPLAVSARNTIAKARTWLKI
jgi:hypothetical protein